MLPGEARKWSTWVFVTVAFYIYVIISWIPLFLLNLDHQFHAAAAAKSLQSCPTLCDPIDGSPPGSPVPGILQARTLEWVAISSSNAWKWKEKVKSLSRVQLVVTPSTAAYQAPPSMDFPGKSTGVECHCLLPDTWWILVNNVYGLSIWVCLMFSHDCIKVMHHWEGYHKGNVTFSGCQITVTLCWALG